MADANPTPKRLRVCYTCEHYEGGHVGEIEFPSGFESDPELTDDWITDLAPFSSTCSRFPPVFSPDHSEAESDDPDLMAERTSCWNQPLTLGVFRCGEWQLREGVTLVPVVYSEESGNGSAA